MALIDCWLDGAGDYRALAAGRPAHAVANLRSIHVELGQSATEGVAMHAKFFSSLALVAFVLRQNFKNVALFELTNGLRVRDAGAVHLRNQAVQFALQGFSSLQFLRGTTLSFCLYRSGLIQSGALCLSCCAPFRICC